MPGHSGMATSHQDRPTRQATKPGPQGWPLGLPTKPGHSSQATNTGHQARPLKFGHHNLAHRLGVAEDLQSTISAVTDLVMIFLQNILNACRPCHPKCQLPTSNSVGKRAFQ